MKFVNWFMKVARIVIHYQETREHEVPGHPPMSKVYHFHRFNYWNPLGWILLIITALGVAVIDGIKSFFDFVISVLRND